MKRIIQQTVPFLKYILFIWIAVGGCCNLYFDFFGSYVDKFFFIIAYFVFCAVFQFFMYRNREIRKSEWGKVFVNAVMIEAYFFVLFAQQHFIAALAVLLGLEAASLLLSHVITSGNYSETDSESRLKRYTERARHLVCCLAAAILIIPCAMGIYEEYVETSVSAEEWAAIVDFFEESKTGSSKNDPFSKYGKTLDNVGKWNTLEDEEKIETVRQIGLIELEHLGVSKDVGIKIGTDKIDEYTMGYYLDSEKQIVINISHIRSDSVEENVNTITHEIFHAYQHYVVSSIDFDSDFVKTSYYFEDAREWKDNIDNYISAEYDFDGYQTQPLEADASAYAEERTAEYMEALSQNQRHLF